MTRGGKWFLWRNSFAVVLVAPERARLARQPRKGLTSGQLSPARKEAVDKALARIGQGFVA